MCQNLRKLKLKTVGRVRVLYEVNYILNPRSRQDYHGAANHPADPNLANMAPFTYLCNKYHNVMYTHSSTLDCASNYPRDNVYTMPRYDYRYSTITSLYKIHALQHHFPRVGCRMLLTGRIISTYRGCTMQRV